MTEISFVELTNNRLENVNGQMNAVIGYNNTLPVFIDKAVRFEELKEREHDIAGVNMCAKGKSQELQEPLLSYSKVLTDYAYAYVEKQLQMMKTVINVDEIEIGRYQVRKTTTNEELKYTVTETECDCFDFKTMKLPCRHVLKIRNMMGQSLFVKDLCLKRWTLDFYKSTKPEYFYSNENQSIQMETTPKLLTVTDDMSVQPTSEKEIMKFQKKESLHCN